MNPGYLSFLLLCMTIILLACGWKNQLIRGVSYPVLFVFIIGWFFCAPLHVDLSGPYRVNLCYFLLILSTIGILLLLKSWVEAVHLISLGLLVGASYVLLNQLIHLDPVYIIGHPYINISFVLSAVCAILIRQPLYQFAVISIGLIAGDITYNFMIYKHLPFELGTAGLYDLWWLIYLGTRITSEVVEQVWRGCKIVFNFWLKD